MTGSDFPSLGAGALSPQGRAKQRNLCLVGPPDCGKTFLLKGLREVYTTYERPDGGSYQLEDLAADGGKELVFLNDFSYDASAKDSCCSFRWQALGQAAWATSLKSSVHLAAIVAGLDAVELLQELPRGRRAQRQVWH